MESFVFRNFTIEPLFNKGVLFSGYDEFEKVPSEANYLVWFYFLPLLPKEVNIHELIENYLYRIDYVLKNANPNQTVLVFSITTRLNYSKYENSNVNVREAVEYYNREIFNLSKENKNVKFIDFDNFLNSYSLGDIIDWKFYYLSKMIINPKLAGSFKIWFEGQINAINFKRKKCLILDLDNTLWGGVLGEEGVEGIQLGADYPGNAYKDFQLLIKQALKAGVILAACSKNNLHDVMNAWETHPEMILKENDFSSLRINWNDKAVNIVEIANELNIGLDSLVFIDDNPRERERIKTELSEVETPDFPENPYDLVKFFYELYQNYFQVYKLSDEDLKKTEQYKDNAKRNRLLKSFDSMDEYIKNLEIELKFMINKNLTRVAQMTQKTNQFNLTTHRYSESDINSFINNNQLIFSLGVSDKFGDNGITGASIVFLDKKNGIAEIDSFLLSCRILGKGIEHIFLKLILNHLFKMGFTKVNTSYIHSSKNSQTKDFYEKNEFTLLNESEKEKNYIYKFIHKFNINNKYKITN